MDCTVVELFAGVGGFRVGLNNITKINRQGRAVEHVAFEFVWANQWEPSTKEQHAFECYTTRFGTNIASNEDICDVCSNDDSIKSKIPDHSLLVGGFPCQDYSVARSIANEKGIEGKKGVLWWEIDKILRVKKPPFVLLENVDRLLKSPSNQRGRDFGIMLYCFNRNGYCVEWRVIDAASYGMPQKRKRTYIFAYLSSTSFAKTLLNSNPKDIIISRGCIAKSFKVSPDIKNIKECPFDLNSKYKNVYEVSQSFEFTFYNSGFMRDGKIVTIETAPSKESQKKDASKILESDVDDKYFLTDSQKNKIDYLRQKKSVPRKSKSGFSYNYSEGSMSKYDQIPPSRTMLTSEGSVNRSSHVIMDSMKQKLRFLTPRECERLNCFPDDWTNCNGLSDSRRYFLMGNALVCDVIKRFGKSISKIIKEED